MKPKAKFSKAERKGDKNVKKRILAIAYSHDDYRSPEVGLHQAGQVAGTVSRGFKELKQDHETAQIVSTDTMLQFS